MPVHPFESQLDRIEQQFNALRGALVHGQAPDVQTAAANLQQLAVEFRQLIDSMGLHPLRNRALTARIRTLAQSFPVLRDNLFRRTAYVEQALATVVPVAQSATYGAAKPYGSVLRQSGEFKVLSA
jgi:hypothetical protein